VTARLDGPIEVEYYREGGILPAVLRRLVRESPTKPATKRATKPATKRRSA
jgi:hypothetical protein